MDTIKDVRNERIATSQRGREADEERARLYAAARATCPLPIAMEPVPLAGGLYLFNDEFVVSVAKEWGWSTERLTLTTHRVLWSKGLINKEQQIVYLRDVRDVRYHKQFLSPGAIALETSGGRSIEGLPAAANGQMVRDQLLSMIHWARQQAQQSAPLPAPDRIEQLRKLAQLRSEGILTDEEFQSEKAKLLTS